MTNTAKLKAKIVEMGLSQNDVANYINVTLATFNYKLNNKLEFKASEIQKLITLLKLSALEVMEIFFEEKVE